MGAVWVYRGGASEHATLNPRYDTLYKLPGEATDEGGHGPTWLANECVKKRMTKERAAQERLEVMALAVPYALNSVSLAAAIVSRARRLIGRGATHQ